MQTNLASKYIQKLSFATRLEDDKSTIIEGHLCRLYVYLSLAESPVVRSHTIYIDTLFSFEAFLHYHGRDITKDAEDAVYFSKLDDAIDHLRTLHASQEILADYLEKAAVILQIVADKTLMVPEDARKIYQGLWKEQAQTYAREAFTLRYAKEQDVPHEIRMLELYKKFAEQKGIAQKYLQYRYCEYRAQCELASRSAIEIDATSHLHHRSGFQDDDADAETPLLTPSSS